MKLRLKISLLLLAGIASIYTACKKSNTQPSAPTFTSRQVAGQVALSISQSLFGGLGAFNASGGLSAPTTLTVHPQGKVLNSLTNPLCGLTIDTTLSYSAAVGDSTVSVSGRIQFSFICTNDVLSGFSTNDNLNFSLSTPQSSYTYKIIESVTMLSLNPSNSHSNLSFKGSINVTDTYLYKTGSKGSGNQAFNYTQMSLIIDPVKSDVISGSASFATQSTGPKGVWNYTGTITFLGNHLATVTINGTTYKVNLQTGVVS
ncbi:MAG: hypothetical protein JWP44_1356 [Mucilaginibacter sp.]|nr:hypothetical protein [Mucilaginibacter sp.]